MCAVVVLVFCRSRAIVLSFQLLLRIALIGFTWPVSDGLGLFCHYHTSGFALYWRFHFCFETWTWRFLVGLGSCRIFFWKLIWINQISCYFRCFSFPMRLPRLVIALRAQTVTSIVNIYSIDHRCSRPCVRTPKTNVMLFCPVMNP